MDGSQEIAQEGGNIEELIGPRQGKKQLPRLEKGEINSLRGKRKAVRGKRIDRCKESTQTGCANQRRTEVKQAGALKDGGVPIPAKVPNCLAPAFHTGASWQREMS